MKTANYLGVTTSTGEVAKYPLSVETLDFIQEQIKELHKILKSVIGIDDGDYLIYSDESYPVICNSGELIPSKHNIKGIKDHLKIEENTQNITADGITYFNARTRKDLIFSDNGASDFYPFEDYQQIRTIREIDDLINNNPNSEHFTKLKKQVEELKNTLDETNTSLKLLKDEYNNISFSHLQYGKLYKEIERLKDRVRELERRTGTPIIEDGNDNGLILDPSTRLH